MSVNISSLIDIFRMDEISKKTRARIIIQLGKTINESISMNLTEPLVYELVKQLEPDNNILTEEHYTRHMKEQSCTTK